MYKKIIIIGFIDIDEQNSEDSQEEVDPDLPNEDLNQHKNWKLLNDEDCGLSISDRIVGGKNASLGQYPWIARLGYAKKILYPDMYDYSDAEYLDENKVLVFECGASLISDLYVVSAAHCVVGLPSSITLARVRLGEHNDQSGIDCEDDVCAEPVQDFDPVKIIPHPEYKDELFKHDIALIKLDRKYNKNGWVYPICTISGDLIFKDYVGTYAEVAGWGFTDRDSEVLAHVLQTIQFMDYMDG
ncbi:CLIP domain-containing serine protease 2-like [Ctenocephalides felis]|uniref:CLIP domain-containing serine protease 2-like n=1 Tax=Ctenocephalides felis TaxID=7515 RepID=UPI000E6E1533|nr:CLIP domain-containing serine protease 2-like [Ctenocephalides felis]